MTTIMNLFFITFLFSFWIWTLKQDIDSLHRRMSKIEGGEAADPADAEPDLDLAHGRHTATVPGKPHHELIKTRDHNGIPTWVIG